MSSETTPSTSTAADQRPRATLAFDIEGTGKRRRTNQLFSFGWCLEETDGTQNKGQVVLYLGKREDEHWREFWERSGFDMGCFDGFWAKNLDKLTPLQLPPGTMNRRHQDRRSKTVYWRFSNFSKFASSQLYAHEMPHPTPGDQVVIEAPSYPEHRNNLKYLNAAKELREQFSPITYIRAFTERDLACVIHEVLLDLQQRYRLTYISDTLHYDASWTDLLLERYGYPPLLHAQSGSTKFRDMCWGRELGSYQMGLSASSNHSDEYSKTKRLLESRISNGWDATNAHFAVDDALKINGAWEEADRENRRRFKLHQRLARIIREKEEGESEEEAEKRDPMPNWTYFYDFVEDNIDDFCDTLKKCFAGIRQRKRNK